MQIAGRTNHDGISVKKIIEKLVETEYQETDVSIAINFLARHGFIEDVKEQKAWGKDDSIELKETDMFKLSPAGSYLLTRLFDEFAFRYCEAIANTMYRSRPYSTPWSKDTDVVSLVENAVGVLKLIVSAAESELKRILVQSTLSEEDKKAKFEKFKETFLHSDVVGSNFLVKITKGCYEIAKYFKTTYFKAQNFEAQIRLRNATSELKDSLRR